VLEGAFMGIQKLAQPERVNDFGTPGVMRLASEWV